MGQCCSCSPRAEEEESASDTVAAQAQAQQEPEHELLERVRSAAAELVNEQSRGRSPKSVPQATIRPITAPASSNNEATPGTIPNPGTIITQANKRSATAPNPSLSNGTWSAERTWLDFSRRFLERPDLNFEHDEGEEKCTACDNFYIGTTHGLRLPCCAQHAMCLDCARNWFKPATEGQPAQNTCPNCRAELFRDDGPGTYDQYHDRQLEMFIALEKMRQSSADVEELVNTL